MDLNYEPYLRTISDQYSQDVALLKRWADINTGSYNITGLELMAHELEKSFAVLNAHFEKIALPQNESINPNGEKKSFPLGPALRWRKRPEAPIQVFLSGHMDTVFDLKHPFQKGQAIDANIYQGPGVSDMKGGLVILLRILQTLESSPWANNIGWQVLIVPDEEISSMGSKPLFHEARGKYQLGLLFEPSYPDGSLVSQRKGALTFSIRAQGIPAHVGRDFHKGKSAIMALAKIIAKSESIMQKHPKAIFNVGEIEGGKAVNIVPDEAICRGTLRVDSKDEQIQILTALQKELEIEHNQSGVILTLTEDQCCPPKPFDASTEKLFVLLQSCASELGEKLASKPSGGVCDGNYLAEAGIPNIDTLGAIGGQLHTPDEYIELDSLTKRAKLSALFLMKLASGQIHLGEPHV